MYCSSILFREKLAKFYIGACHDNLENRIIKHNNHTDGSHHFTAITNDWILFFKISCLSYSMSIRIEKHIKKMKNSAYINNLKKYPEMIAKIVDNNII